MVGRHDELVAQAERLAATEAAYAGSSLAVGSLQAALRRVRAEILEPYQQVFSMTWRHTYSRACSLRRTEMGACKSAGWCA